MSTNTATAATQGTASADAASSALSARGLQGSIAYLDVEQYTVPAGNTTCSPAVRSYVNAWVAEMHRNGNQAGVYSSPSNILADMVPGAVANVPDQIWGALYNNQANSSLPPLPSNLWGYQQRTHQYAGNQQLAYMPSNFKGDLDWVAGEVAYYSNKSALCQGACTNPCNPSCPDYNPGILNVPGLFLALLTCSFGAAQKCSDLSAQKRAEILHYVKARYSLPDIANVQLIADDAVEDACFRKLTFSTSYPDRKFTMYLTADQRYLTSTLLDLSVDPEIERQRNAEENRTILETERSPSLGLAGSPVTIVEFLIFSAPIAEDLPRFLTRWQTQTKRGFAWNLKSCPLKCTNGRELPQRSPRAPTSRRETKHFGELTTSSSNTKPCLPLTTS